jgi:hypothetical protein
MIQENSVQRFEANEQAARTERIWTGIAVAVFGAGSFYFSDVQNPLILILVAVIGGVIGYGTYALRNHYRAARSIELTADGLVITQPRQQIRLAWTELSAVGQRSHYGDFLTFQITGKKHPYVVLLDGYTPEQIASIQKSITLHHQAKQQ